jgi:carbon-monoxide dehydrogenase iron sulfur subunit
MIEEEGGISFAVSCRHCGEPLCVKSCITGAMGIRDGVIEIDRDKCVGCYTCIMACPYGAVMPDGGGAIQKCELCIKNAEGEPACVTGCPNKAIVFEERGA